MTHRMASIADEFAGAELGDLRLSARLVRMGEDLAARPDQPLPDVFLTEAGLEGAYRFLNNCRVTPSAVLAPHIEATSMRARAAGRLLVLHDTTALHFEGRGFGPLRGAGLGEGFYAHVALAVDAANHRAPLGVLGLRTFEREERAEGRRKTPKERRADNELHHWSALLEDVMDTIGDVPAVHVMDRQADSYALLATMAARTDFVVRATHDRVVNSDGERARALLAAAPTVLQRTVPITARKGSGWTRDRHHPVREERTVTLHIMAAAIELQRPVASNATPRGTTPPVIRLNVVRVVEVDAPKASSRSNGCCGRRCPSIRLNTSPTSSTSIGRDG